MLNCISNIFSCCLHKKPQDPKPSAESKENTSVHEKEPQLIYFKASPVTPLKERRKSNSSINIPPLKIDENPK